MNVQDFLNTQGNETISNPLYNPKSKKNTQPKTLSVPAVFSNDHSSAVNLGVRDFMSQYSIGSKEADKYRDYGLNWNPNEDMYMELVKAQGAFSKFKNSIAQAIGSELVLGTFKGISDLVDLVGQATGISDEDYSNPVSQALEEAQESFKNWAPIYADPNKNISNGGLADSGWWASNIPSVVSSLTLLIPSTGVVKGLSFAGKALKINKGLNKAAIAIAKAEKNVRGLNKFGTFGKYINSTRGKLTAQSFFENGMTAALSRAMENYQEARQSYNNVYLDASDYLKSLQESENPEDIDAYNRIIEENDAILKDKDGNYTIDINDPKEVAKKIAKVSADRTFQMDWVNVVFDVLQMYALKNAWKGFKNNPENSAKVRRAEIDAKKYAGKSAEEIAKLKTARSFGEKSWEFIEDKLIGTKLLVTAELSEGVEEAINYIAQEEGSRLGRVLLNKEEGDKNLSFYDNLLDVYDNRLKSYAKNPELWDSAFWGVLGGVVFQGLGSKFRQISNKLTESKDKEANNAKNNLPWYKLSELPEVQRRLTEINTRQKNLNDYKAKLDRIKKGIDIYSSTADKEIHFDSKEEQDAAIKRLRNDYITEMTITAMNAGNLDMFKAYMADDNVRKAMIEAGFFNEEGKTKSEQELESESKNYLNEVAQIIDKVERTYDEELVDVNAAAAESHIFSINGSNIESYIPAEYLQIIALNNVRSKFQIENINSTIEAVDAEIERLKLQYKDKLDENIDYEDLSEIVVLTNILKTLRADRKTIANHEKQSLKSQIALDEIDKQIKAVEDTLDNHKLAYATFISLLYKYDDNHNLIKGETEEDVLDAFIYRDKLLVGNGPNDERKVVNIVGLEHLSDKARTLLSTEDKANFDKLESDIRDAAVDLKEVPQLSTYYQLKAYYKHNLRSVQNNIAKTQSEVREQAMMLHNTLDKARTKEIHNATETIIKLYKKAADEVRDIVYATNPNKIETTDLTEDEKKELISATQILALSKSYNVSLFHTLENLFNNLDIIAAQKSVVNDDNIKNVQEPSENKADISEESNQMNNSTAEPQTPSNEPNLAQNQPLDAQSIDDRTPNFYVNVKSHNGKFYLGTKEETEAKETYVSVYDNNDGTYTINTTNERYLKAAELFGNGNEVDFTRPYAIEEYPIATRDDKGHLKIESLGRLKNTDTISNDNNDNNQQVIADDTSTQNNSSTGEVSQQPITSTSQINQNNNNVSNTPINGIPTVQNIPNTTQTSNPSQTSTSSPVEETAGMEDTLDDSFSIQTKILQELVTKWKSDNNIDIDATAKELGNTFKTNGYTATIVDGAVNAAASLLKKKLNAKNKMQSSIAELYIAQSAITELVGVNPFTEAYKKAAEAMIKVYAKEVKCKTIDGKVYINLENLLYYVNDTMNNSSAATEIYDFLREYLNTKEGQEKFVIKDNSTFDFNRFLEKAAQSIKGYENVITSGMTRVDINTIPKLLEGDAKAIADFYDAIDDLQEGDVLNVVNKDKYLVLVDSKNRVVGSMPIPKIDPSIGGYIMVNKGWNSDVNFNNSTNDIDSRLKDLFINFLLNPEPKYKELNDIINEYAFTNPDDATKAALVNKFKNNDAIKEAHNNGYIAGLEPDYEECLSGLADLWKFTSIYDFKDDAQLKIYVESTLINWFANLNYSYNIVSALNQGSRVTCTVGSINNGEIIRVKEHVTQDDIKTLPVVGKAIAGGVNPSIHKLAFCDKNNINQIAISGEADSRPFGRIKKGTTMIAIPNRSGAPDYVQAFPLDLNDNEIGQDAKDIVTAVHEEFIKLMKAHADGHSDKTYEAIKDFIIKTFSSSNSNSSLFYNVKAQVNTYTSGNESVSLSIPGTTQSIIVFKRSRQGGSSTQYAVGNKYLKFADKEGFDYFKTLLNNMKFNMSYAYFYSDRVSDVSLNGIVKKQNGKFTITVGDKTWTYNSFNEFVLTNNLIRVNTQLSNDGKSNYNRKGTRTQKANQVFRVKVDINSTQNPTLGSQQVDITPKTKEEESKELKVKINDILDSNISKNKGLDIAKLIFKDDVINTFENLAILPKKIKFDASFNSKTGYNTVNAEINTSTGEVTVGTKWLDMISDDKTRNQAIRKLIHEQLHYKLRSHPGYLESVKGIFQEFKDAINGNLDNDYINSLAVSNNLTKEQIIEHFKSYFFDTYINEKGVEEKYSEQESIEEFLVETLTSEELAKLLNSIDAKDYKISGRKTLFQKILEALANIFGWDVRKGSLYEKELSVLKDMKSINPINNKEVTNNTEAQANSDFNNQEPSNNINEKQTTKNDTSKDVESITPIQQQQSNIVLSNDISNDLMDEFDSSITELNSVNRKSSITELSNEEQEIKDNAIKNGTFMKAPNGNPTNLTEQQWLRVRTKAFKTWFGDWEKINKFNLDNIDTSKVEIELVDKPWKSDASKVNKTVRIYLKGQKEKGYFELVKDYEPFMYSVHFKTNKPGAKYSGNYAESTKEDRKTLFKELIKAIPKGASVSTWGSLSQEGVKAIDNVGRDMIKVGEREVILKDTNESIKIPIYQNGESEVSKVVDENGEPLVVYHGTNRDNITEFSTDKAKFKTGIFTASSINTARSYVDWNVIGYYYNIQNSEIDNFKENETYEEYKNRIQEQEKDNNLPFSFLISEDAFYARKQAIQDFNSHIYQLFVNLKNPYIIDANKKDWNKLLYKGTPATTEDLALYAKEDGFDGVIILNVRDNGLKNKNDIISGYDITNDYIAFNSNQIKSATDNNGNYSTKDDNIKHSSVDELSITAPSVSSFAQRLSLEKQIKFGDMVANAAIKSSCR